MRLCVLTVCCCLTVQSLSAGKAKQASSALDEYIAGAMARGGRADALPAAGAVWSPSSGLADLARDPIAFRVDDVLTIVVAERASAVTSGTTKSARSSSARASVDALGGMTRAAGPLANLARLGSEQNLDGQGNTSRETALTTTLTGRVTHVLPNGYLAVEGQKTVRINSESQVVLVRGIVRPIDLSAQNSILSDQISQMEVRIDGKGVVTDAIRRPFFLYRLLLGILPF
jgi:flagellar L-ring protein FlgH